LFIYGFSSVHILSYLYLLQAGDLYEKVNRNDEALQCYKKGYAYRRGMLFMMQTPYVPYSYLFCTWKSLCLDTWTAPTPPV